MQAGRVFALLLGALLITAVTTLGMARADTRIALVIGNSRYLNTPALGNPSNDATDIAAALSTVGFNVTLQLDATKRQFDQALAQFSRDAKTADAALFYYAGHGMQYQGRNFLMPVDAELRDEVSLRYEMTTVDEVKEALRASRGVKILVLDSCRDNPLANQLVRSIEVSTRDVPRVQGFARDERTNGMVIVYSTQADEVARDGSGRNSPFSTAFLKELKEPGLEVGALFRRVESDVFEATNGLQSPELSISMVPEYYLNQSETDQTVWARVRPKADANALKAFIARYPNSFYALDAAARLDLLESQARKDDEAQRVANAVQAASDEAARLNARQGDLDDAEKSAKTREHELTARLSAAESEKAKLGGELAKSAQERVRAEQQFKQQAGQEERDRAQREAALRAQIERLQASDAEKQRLLQKALDEDRARADSERQAALDAEKAAKDVADAKARADDQQAQELRQRIAKLEADASAAQAESEREAQKAADGRKAAEKAQQQLVVANSEASGPAAEPVPAPTIVPLIREQLRRLGCYAGGDLGWETPAFKLGVAKYVRYANFAKAAPSPDQTLLDDMQKRRAALCPPECSPREVAVGGRCVARACPGGAFLSRSGACVQQQAPRHIPRQATEEDDSPPPHSARARSSPRAAPSHSGGGGHCFSFNGNQYCE